jgi:hypothetical protein
MLSPNEFSVGYLAAATGLTLVLRDTTRGTPFIVAPTTQSMIAVALDGDHRFSSFDCRGNTSWEGLVIPNVAIEVDETSIIDNAPLGILLRTGTILAIKTRMDRLGTQLLPLVGSLTPCHEDLQAAFSRWRVVIGDGFSKRELMAIAAV